ncbi:hypothetical protein NHJ13734_009719, partial [Beauveria thailandica]
MQPQLMYTVAPASSGSRDLSSDQKIALVRQQRGAGVEKAERTSANPWTPAFRLGDSVGDTKARPQDEARDRLKEHPAGRPDEMHVHPLRDKDLATEQELVVQRTRRQRHPDPEPAMDAVESLQVELLFNTGRDMLTSSSQVTRLFT